MQDFDIESQVRELLRAAGRCPKPGEPVPDAYLEALLSLRDLAAPGWWQPSGNNCRCGPGEEWYELLDDAGKIIGVIWGRKDGQHIATAFLLAALVNLLPALAGEVLARRQGRAIAAQDQRGETTAGRSQQGEFLFGEPPMNADAAGGTDER